MQSLYSALGSPDDLDMVLGTARLDTVYCAVANQFDLIKYYYVSNRDSNSVRKAASILKKRTRVIKTDYGELQVKVWDHDRDRAATLANAIMEKLQQIHQDVQARNNTILLSKINDEYVQKNLDYQKLSDSSPSVPARAGGRARDQSTTDLLSAQRSSLLQQMLEYGRLLDQYKLMVNAKPQALIIIERATPPLKADKPKTIAVITGATVLSLFFGLLAALVLERRRATK
jgi:uncharacterized protein involved in exopolysaccharide biosynthesis